jgi:hypothetical protein
MKFTLRRKLAVAATALTAGVALPIQAGAAHASTPEENLSACISSAIAGPEDGLSISIDACVNTFLQEMGIDPPTDFVAADTPPPTDDTATNTAILGTVDDSTAVPG